MADFFKNQDAACNLSQLSKNKQHKPTDHFRINGVMNIRDIMGPKSKIQP